MLLALGFRAVVLHRQSTRHMTLRAAPHECVYHALRCVASRSGPSRNVPVRHDPPQYVVMHRRILTRRAASLLQANAC